MDLVRWWMHCTHSKPSSPQEMPPNQLPACSRHCTCRDGEGVREWETFLKLFNPGPTYIQLRSCGQAIWASFRISPVYFTTCNTKGALNIALPGDFLPFLPNPTFSLWCDIRWRRCFWAINLKIKLTTKARITLSEVCLRILGGWPSLCCLYCNRNIGYRATWDQNIL